MRNEDLIYWEGEKPPPLAVRWEDQNGNLITTISGAVLAAKTKIDEEAEVSVPMTNNDDGTMTINWPATSVFIIPAAGGRETATMRIDIEVTQGALVWFLPRFTVPILKRN